uniref:HMG box domain-containing protein n=2 Tax=Meloidogyne TaxID=189290 RepID=A0A914L7D0_MELIC
MDFKMTNSYIVNTPSGQYTIQQQPTCVTGVQQPQQIIHHLVPQQRPAQSSFSGGVVHHNERPLVRGKTSPYGFFVKMCYEEHKKKYPNECVQVTEISKKCSQKWKTMTDEEKKRFFELAQKDAERYQAEVAAYGGEDVLKKKKRAKKDPNAPKRALSAFFFFSNDKRQEVSGEHPEWKVGQIAQELGLRWKALSDDERIIFEKKAQEDKERYAEEMKAYRSETSQLVGCGNKFFGQMGDQKSPERLMQSSMASTTTTMVTSRQPQMVIVQQQGQPGQLPMQILEEHVATSHGQ